MQTGSSSTDKIMVIHSNQRIKPVK